MPALPFRLLLITDWALEDVAARVARALEAGPRIAVQHRHPGATTRRFLAEAEALAQVCAHAGAPLFINGRLDVALALGVHLHLPAVGLRAGEARPHLPGKWLSVAVHDQTEARAARGADLALVSPVFTPGSKPGDTRKPLGPAGYNALTAALPCPAFALGGMTVERLDALGEVPGVAVVSDVLGASDPRAAARAWLARWPGP